MKTAEFLRSLLAADVRVRLEADKVRVSAPQGRLTPELQRALAERKQEIRSFLVAHGPVESLSASEPAEGEFPVTFAQQRLWFLDHLEPGSSAYNLATVHTIDAEVDVGVLEASINEVIRRQGALRTAFREERGIIWQIVSPFEPLPLERIDLTALPPEERARQLAHIRREEAGAPFDLARAPLLRAKLVSCGRTHHELLITMHHIVSDNWSLGIFFQELQATYLARVRGQQGPLPPLLSHYGTHATQERTRLQGAELQRLVDGWAARLRGAPPTVALPTDRPRPPRQTYNGAYVAFTLPPELARALQQLARNERATPYMTLLAIFNALLYRYSAQTDIVVGTPIANRATPDLEQLIGLFVSTLPIRTRLDPEAGIRKLIALTREAVLEAQAGQDLPFEKLVEALRPERSMSRSPIFQIVFALQSTPLASAFEVQSTGSTFDLSLFMWENAGAVRGVLEYNTDLFDAATIERMRDHFVALCAAAVAEPDCALARLPMLTAAEERQLLEDWSGRRVDYPRDASIPEVFEAVCARAPEAIALQTTDPQAEIYPVARLTYGELSRASSALAQRLTALGILPGMPVALYLERSIAAVVTFLAVLKAGAAYVPLSNDAPRERTIEILRNAGVRHVLTTAEGARKFAPFDIQAIDLDSQWQLAQTGSGESIPVRRAPGDLAYLMFTSGTTGVPKGVCVTHRNILRLACSADYIHLGPEETLLQFAPLPFDASTFEIWGALLNGARLVVFPGHVPNAREFAGVLDEHGVTTLWLTAGFFNYIVENECETLARVRQVLAGGDVLSVTHVQKLLDAKSDGVIVNGYGPTENTTFTCCQPLFPGTQLGTSVPIGRPIPNTSVYVLDPAGRPVPVGVAGELYAGGDGVAGGYLNGSADTVARFLKDPFDPSPGAMMYRTGDAVRWRADGTLEFLGRQDRQVKVRGFRIELEEIEHALRECAPIADVAVIAQRDSGGTNVLVAYVVPDAGHPVDVTEVRRLLSEHVHDYMIPSAFVMLDALPLTANGKVDRNALPLLQVARRGTVVEPRTQVETQLLNIWHRVLERTDFGIRDNFFELGGHSLLAVRLFALIERVFGRRLPVSALFQAPTIERLAMRLEREGFKSPWGALVAIQPEGTRPPLFLVPGIGGNVICYADLAPLLGKDQPVYGLQSRGLDGREPPFKRLQPMAAHYVSEIRKVQPNGPYYLGGACFGGAVVWEMAQQLRAAGEEVAFLALLETWPPPNHRLRYLIARRLQYLRLMASVLKENVIRFMKTPVPGMLQDLRNQLRATRQFLEGRADLNSEFAALYIDRISMSNFESFAYYGPKPYDGFVMLIIASERPLQQLARDPRLDWAVLVRGECVVRGIPARDSGWLLKDPHRQPLSELLREGMGLADARRAGSLADNTRRTAG